MCSSAVTSCARVSVLDSVLAVAVDMDHVAVVMPGVRPDPRLGEGSTLDSASLAMTRLRACCCGGGGDAAPRVPTRPCDRDGVALTDAALSGRSAAAASALSPERDPACI